MTDTLSPATPDKSALRDAASVIVLRRDAGAPARVLMGQRGSGAAFMPQNTSFPVAHSTRATGAFRLPPPCPHPMPHDLKATPPLASRLRWQLRLCANCGKKPG